ncbi:MAG: SurA N-terminal domain-containing protein [Pseudomonadota bacterium]|nr:SurA N-terminal domain-containing protein [Pseudomonadota bacterium]
MFEFFRKHMRIFQILLAVLIIPSFGFLGVQGYRGMSEGSNQTVAKVAGQSITQAEWDMAHRDQVERVRRQRPNVDPKLLDSPELRQQSLDNLIRERVMLVAADKLRLSTTDDRLQRLFTTDPQFASIRNTDGSVNKDLLAAQGMSSDTFARRLRQDLSVQQVLIGVSGTGFASTAAADHAVDAFFQQREVSLQRFETAGYTAKVNPSDAEIEQYFKDAANAQQFQAPEQASIEYVVLDLEAMKQQVSINEEELRKYYSENASRYTTPEERRASHILIAADKALAAPERAKAKAKAEELLAQIRKTPDVFADLAKKNSQDPGSAVKGGDLDFFGRGAMVKPFEDTAFALKVGETSGVVESDFGFHIIRVTDMRGGDKRSFDAVRSEIETEVRLQLAQAKYSEAAAEFTNLVYEQADSLKPAADKFKLEMKTAQGITRKPASGAQGPLASPKFLDALFSNDALHNKRNTDAVETAANQLVSGRVLRYDAARALPLADVKDKVRARVVELQATALARKEGEARLALLKLAPQTDMGIESRLVSRLQMQDLGEPTIDAVLGANPSVLPAFVGVDLGAKGYVVAKIQKIIGRDPVAADPARARSQYVQAWGEAETQAYYAALKTRMKVWINDKTTAQITRVEPAEGR